MLARDSTRNPCRTTTALARPSRSSLFLTTLVPVEPTGRRHRCVRTRRERFGSTMVRTRAIVQHLLERRGDVRLLALLADHRRRRRTMVKSGWTSSSGRRHSIAARV